MTYPCVSRLSNQHPVRLIHHPFTFRRLVFKRTFGCVPPRMSAELIPPPPSSFTSTPGFLAPWPPIHHQCRIGGKTSLNLSLTYVHLSSYHSQHSCLPPRSEHQRYNYVISHH
ncbi:hypothetical protein ILYODFUR_010735 [Ilyodon furcidens]|uniref:Uncharacterized protein n=1 Tax=Ilyodon furcidens TaxID=33524 RepID=A0ABV0UHU9_9TELE